ncbi:MAG: leucyl aminopeptidase [Gammaproteobacteria bacterium]|nr:leucyl aminopeptidase [Gammaproteobacteria bacterium]
MDFSVKTNDVVKLASPCLVLGVYQGEKATLTPLGERVDSAGGHQFTRFLKRGDFSADAGVIQMFYDIDGIKADRVMLVGLGRQSNHDPICQRNVISKVTSVLSAASINAADLAIFDGLPETMSAYSAARNTIESVGESLYQYTATRSDKKKPSPLKKISLVVAKEQSKETRRAVTQGRAIAHGVHTARTLADLPGNICTPTYLAKQAKDLQKTHSIKTKIVEEAEMKRLKMGSFLSVSRGSREPAKLIVMEYSGGKKGQKPVVLVGKGLTFDAGGISLKPAGGMDEMKYDMCGGASVFGALVAASEMDLKLNVVGIVPASENMPDGAANKPGDVVTSMLGKTIEILNTDAEGRLILCDALTYAERFKPAAVVDIATLTGACVVALGEHASGLFSNCDSLAEEIEKAGQVAGDRAWRLPVWDDYSKQLKSNFADLANIGGKGAGAVTAACFLKHFANNFDWAHLDVAGTAWKSGGAKGATGRPVPLLVEFLINRAR